MPRTLFPPCFSSVSSTGGPAREVRDPYDMAIHSRIGSPSPLRELAFDRHAQSTPAAPPLLLTFNHALHPSFSGCRATALQLLAHACESLLTVDHLISPGRPTPWLRPPLRYAMDFPSYYVWSRRRVPDCTTRLLADPPLGVLPLATNCSVTGSRRAYSFRTEPDRTHAACTPDTTWARRVTPRPPSQSKTRPLFRLSISVSTLQSAEGRSTHRSYFFPVHTPDTITARLFLHRSRTTSSSQGPVFGFEASSALRLRRSRQLLHLLIRTHVGQAYHAPPAPPLRFTKSSAKRSCGRLEEASPSGDSEGPTILISGNSTTSEARLSHPSAFVPPRDRV